MVFEGLLRVIGTILKALVLAIPALNIDTSQLTVSVDKIINYAKWLNEILPLNEALIFAIVALTVKGIIFAFWGAMRIINLIRGAG